MLSTSIFIPAFESGRPSIPRFARGRLFRKQSGRRNLFVTVIVQRRTVNNFLSRIPNCKRRQGIYEEHEVLVSWNPLLFFRRDEDRSVDVDLESPTLWLPLTAHNPKHKHTKKFCTVLAKSDAWEADFWWNSIDVIAGTLLNYLFSSQCWLGISGSWRPSRGRMLYAGCVWPNLWYENYCCHHCNKHVRGEDVQHGIRLS